MGWGAREKCGSGNLRIRRRSALSYGTSSVHRDDHITVTGRSEDDRVAWKAHLSNHVLRARKMTGDTRHQASTAVVVGLDRKVGDLKGSPLKPLHGFAEFAREKVRKTFPRWKKNSVGKSSGRCPRQEHENFTV